MITGQHFQELSNLDPEFPFVAFLTEWRNGKPFSSTISLEHISSPVTSQNGTPIANMAPRFELRLPATQPNPLDPYETAQANEMMALNFQHYPALDALIRECLKNKNLNISFVDPNEITVSSDTQSPDGWYSGFGEFRATEGDPRPQQSVSLLCVYQSNHPVCGFAARINTQLSETEALLKSYILYLRHMATGTIINQ